MKLSRREIGRRASLGLGTAAVASALVTGTSAQTSSQDLAVTNPAKAAHDSNQLNSEALAKFQVSLETEPASQFRA